MSTPTISYGSSIQRRLPSARIVFSWALGSRTTVLSRIRHLVTSPNYTPSSVAPIVNSCAAALSVSEFSDLLQSLYIGGHTAMYWAIVNDRREALSALVGYISQISSVCSDDLRTACMLVSDHILFTQLGLELEIGPSDKPLRDSLGRSPFVDHEVEVLEGDGVYEDHFVALVQFKRCQRSLRIVENMSAEFIARGRIWWLRIFYWRHIGKWCLSCGLSPPSLPARPEVVIIIEAQRDKRGCASRLQDLRQEHRLTPEYTLLAPLGYLVGKPEKACNSIRLDLGDWLMNNNTAYLDYDGTLRVHLGITLRKDPGGL
ncbi:hypothetical protein M405DRAFT_933170 [Rhizopogon salebrosus TDB-379]|nr:hypothetical protein M405DRAFT_933170 [Rhizopogon salebrosus TDB-379]